MFKFGPVKTYYFEFNFSKKDENLKVGIFNYINCEENSHLKGSGLGLIINEFDGKKIGKIYYRFGTKSQTETRKIREDLKKQFNLSSSEIFFENNWFRKLKLYK